MARVDRTLAVAFERFEVDFDGSLHRQRTCDAIARLSATHHVRASLVLRLRKTQDDCSVGIAKVVGSTDLLNYVALTPDIVARNPCPCNSGSALVAFYPAVANMQARFKQPVVWLATSGEPASALSALKPCVGSS